jgi:hypothetical protein
MRHAPARTPAILLAALGLAAPAVAGPLEVIYTKKAGHPKAAVPGAVDLSGNPESVEWKGIEDLAVSPDGSRWIVKARTTAATDHDTGIVAGSGAAGAMMTVSTASGPFIIQEGRPAPFGASADWIDFIPSGFGRFDQSNNLVFGVRARTTQTGSTTSPDAMRVCTTIAGDTTLAFKQGDLYLNLQDLSPAPSGDETVGNSVGSFHLLNDGRIGSQDTTVINLHSSRRPVLTYSRDKFLQPGIDTAVAFGGSGAVTWSTFEANAFYTTPDGAHWWAAGRHTNSLSGPRVFVYDGQVRLEADQAVPGSGIVVGDILQAFMAPSGSYIARGRDNSGSSAAAPDWAVVDGALVAATGDPITPGSSEHWGDTFYAVAINSAGDYLIAGNTDNPDAGADGVIVLNGATVVMREGDSVDLDGNGQFDDDAFIGRGVNTNAPFNASTSNGPTSWWLTEDLTLYGIAMLRDTAGNDLTTNPPFATPQALVRVALGEPQACYPNCDGSTVNPVLNVLDFNCFLNRFSSGAAYANCDGSTVEPVLNVLDFNCFLNRFSAGCSAP